MANETTGKNEVWKRCVECGEAMKGIKNCAKPLRHVCHNCMAIAEGKPAK